MSISGSSTVSQLVKTQAAAHRASTRAASRATMDLHRLSTRVLYRQVSHLAGTFRAFRATFSDSVLIRSRASRRWSPPLKRNPSRKKTLMTRVTIKKFHSEQGMTLFAVMAMMAIFAIGLLAVAPSIQEQVQREKELETIARGEEVADAIRQYVVFYGGAKLPNSMKDLLDGLPRGTKKRMILRQSAAIDPLSEDGKWRLIQADVKKLGPFAKAIQKYNGGALPTNPSPQVFDRYSVVVVNSVNNED